MAIDDEVARCAEFIVTRTRLQERSAVEQWEALLQEIARELVLLAIENALAQVRIRRRVAAPTNTKSSIIRGQRRPACDAGKVVARQIGESESIVTRRRPEVMHISKRSADPRSHELRKSFRKPRSKSEDVRVRGQSCRRPGGLDVLKARTAALSKGCVS